jgi:hypothetical protein
MPWYRCLAGVVACFVVGASSAKAILIETGGVRVGGYLVSEDDKKLTIRTLTPEGEEAVKEYPRDKIKVLHQLDAKRLTELSSDKPKAYRDYADELARQDADPEARYMARRLYLIAASLDKKNLGVSCLVRLSALAGSPAEARRCRALAYLFASKAEGKVLLVEGKAAKPPRPSADALRDFTKALQAYRAGKVKLADDIAGRKGMDAIFQLAPVNLDVKSFRRMCTDANCATCKATGRVQCTACLGKGVVRNMFGVFERCTTCNGKKVITCAVCDGRGVTPDLSNDTLRTLLGAELWATEQLLGGAVVADKKKSADNKSWSAVLQRRRLNPVLPLSLETITEFDPRKCHYRDGSWVVPSEKGGEK